jgi:hypothetical protein
MSAAAVVVLIVIATTNCGVQETLASLQRETDRAAQSIEKEVGARPTIGVRSSEEGNHAAVIPLVRHMVRPRDGHRSATD